MKTHYAEEFDDASQFNETAEEHVWREHRLTPGSALGNAVAVALLAAALVVFLKLSLPAVQPAASPALGFTGSTWTHSDAHGSVLESGDERERQR